MGLFSKDFCVICEGHGFAHGPCSKCGKPAWSGKTIGQKREVEKPKQATSPHAASGLPTQVAPAPKPPIPPVPPAAPLQSVGHYQWLPYKHGVTQGLPSSTQIWITAASRVDTRYLGIKAMTDAAGVITHMGATTIRWYHL